MQITASAASLNVADVPAFQVTDPNGVVVQLLDLNAPAGQGPVPPGAADRAPHGGAL